ncbi:MAG: polysaccharide biosynthesis protein [Paracoccaceae bacterium]
MREIPDSVLITGGTGSFGKTMLRDLLASGVPELRILSRDEAKQDALRNELRDSRIAYFIGDVRDADTVARAMRGIDSVFHAAAMKQVPSCEFFPLEAVRTNILGSDNVIRTAIALGVRSLVCLSTDKAVQPVNAMGLSKAMMEKVAQSAARSLGADAKTTISCVRYGNVMFSRGSVIPLFVDQIRSGRPITVTEPAMSRFLMPLSDSVALVRFAFRNARPGDVFVKKAAAATMANLVQAMRELFGVPDHPVEVVGWRHGEKLYETLASAAERMRSQEYGDYIRIAMDGRDLNYRAGFGKGGTRGAKASDYDSHRAAQLDVAEVKNLLLRLPEIRAELANWREPLKCVS